MTAAAIRADGPAGTGVFRRASPGTPRASLRCGRPGLCSQAEALLPGGAPPQNPRAAHSVVEAERTMMVKARG